MIMFLGFRTKSCIQVYKSTGNTPTNNIFCHHWTTMKRHSGSKRYMVWDFCPLWHLTAILERLFYFAVKRSMLEVPIFHKHNQSKILNLPKLETGVKLFLSTVLLKKVYEICCLGTNLLLRWWQTTHDHEISNKTDHFMVEIIFSSAAFATDQLAGNDDISIIVLERWNTFVPAWAILAGTHLAQDNIW